MDNKGFSYEAKNKIGGESKSFSKYLTNAEFSFPLAKSPQCTDEKRLIWKIHYTRTHKLKSTQKMLIKKAK